MKNNSVALVEKVYHREDLECGLMISPVLGWKHAQYEDRSPESKKQYDRLKAHLIEHGLLNPLITHRGHVLIGQRRFEIMRDRLETFLCLEVDEDIVGEWTPRRVPILTQTVRKAYAERTKAQRVTIPSNL